MLNQQAERSILRNQPVPKSIPNMRTNLEVEQSGTISLSYFPVDLPSQLVPLNPMVLLIIIPMNNGYFIGNIPIIFRQTQLRNFFLPGCQERGRWHRCQGDVPRATGAGTRSAWHRDSCGQGVPWRQLELSHVEPLF